MLLYPQLNIQKPWEHHQFDSVNQRSPCFFFPFDVIYTTFWGFQSGTLGGSNPPIPNFFLRGDPLIRCGLQGWSLAALLRHLPVPRPYATRRGGPCGNHLRYPLVILNITIYFVDFPKDGDFPQLCLITRGYFSLRISYVAIEHGDTWWVFPWEVADLSIVFFVNVYQGHLVLGR